MKIWKNSLINHTHTFHFYSKPKVYILQWFCRYLFHKVTMYEECYGIFNGIFRLKSHFKKLYRVTLLSEELCPKKFSLNSSNCTYPTRSLNLLAFGCYKIVHFFIRIPEDQPIDFICFLLLHLLSSKTFQIYLREIPFERINFPQWLLH